jgi:hypothetical protein
LQQSSVTSPASVSKGQSLEQRRRQRREQLSKEWEEKYAQSKEIRKHDESETQS